MARIEAKGCKLRSNALPKVKVPPKKAAPFYLSPEWRALMDGIIRIRGRRCEDPLHDPTRPRICRRIFGDHIRELKDGGAPLDQHNIMLRCGSCHTRKTAAERARRYGVGGV